jgi:ketosteroid isomerase-like protein
MGSGPFFGGLGSGDFEAIMARMTDDCVHESTGLTPDGQLHDGPAAVRSVWEQFFGDTKDPKFTDEDTFRGTAPASGDVSPERAQRTVGCAQRGSTEHGVIPERQEIIGAIPASVTIYKGPPSSGNVATARTEDALKGKQPRSASEALRSLLVARHKRAGVG